MKILLVIDSLGSGGAQNQLTLLAGALSKSEHTVHLLTYFKDDFFAYRLKGTAIKHHFIQKKGKLGLNVIIRLKQLYNTEHYDGVLSYLDTPNFYAIAAGKIAKHRPFSIISYRSHSNFRQMGKIEIFQKKWLNTQADAIVANSHHERINWQQKDTKNADKWSTVYNLVDLDKYRPLTTKKRPAIFIGIGKVRPLKNIDLILDALILLRKHQEKSAVIHWYGERSREHPTLGPTVRLLEEKIIQNNLQNNFIWKDAIINIHEILPDYGALIHPSLLEGLPNVVCEAMACGLPVIISNLFDHSRLVEDGKRGFLIEPQDAEGLASCMVKIMRQPEHSTMSTNARTYAESAFAERIGLQQYLNIFNQA